VAPAAYPIAHRFLDLVAVGHVNFTSADFQTVRRQNRHCLPPSDNRQKREADAAVLAGRRQILPSVAVARGFNQPAAFDPGHRKS
jgi:hypothetical protein